MANNKIITGGVYHVYTKSIAGYIIFNNESEYERMKDAIQHFQWDNRTVSFSRISKHRQGVIKPPKTSIAFKQESKRVQIAAYCIMPTHIHFILKQIQDKGISGFLNNLLNSYTRYFNLKHKRKGPLWEGRFKRVAVASDEQLLHLTRYIHLNPVTAYIVEKAEDWPASSYRQFINAGDAGSFCQYDDLLEINPEAYKKFVEDRAAYQRELAKIKHLLLEETTNSTA